MRKFSTFCQPFFSLELEWNFLVEKLPVCIHTLLSSNDLFSESYEKTRDGENNFPLLHTHMTPTLSLWSEADPSLPYLPKLQPENRQCCLWSDPCLPMGTLN